MKATIRIIAAITLACVAANAWAGRTLKNDGQAYSCHDSSDHRKCGSSPQSTAQDSGHGMPVYQFRSLLASLNIEDTPVSYAPPVGPAIDITLSYNQREVDQPATFHAFNLGQNWTLNWLSWVQDDPATPGSNVLRYVSGGGGETYSGYSAATGAFSPEPDNGAVLVMTSSNPVTYELRRADGSKDVFAESNGQTSYPRKVFLTARIDPQGNAVTLHYDSQMRLTSISDAIGQSATFQYGNTTSPLVITSITDPFGRHTTLGYDSAGRLDSITDEIGMTSSFAYADTGTFIQSMTTPYGTTTFAHTEGAGDATELSIQATDPLGYTERTEYRIEAPGAPYSESQAPSGMFTFNAYLNYRDSYYWDKSQFAAACTLAGTVATCDYTKARNKHFLHELPCCTYTSRYLESVKYPLEARLWYDYAGQQAIGAALPPGTLAEPAHVGRVLDDGSTQLTAYTYNAQGNVLTHTDPDGRETVNTYAANGIDLTEVQQKTAAGFDTVAQYTYNAQHEPLTATDAAGQTTTYAYNARGQRTVVTDPLGHTTTFAYDGNGYLTTITNALGHVQHSFTYDSDGRVASDTDAQGYVRQYQYDALNRVTRISYPDGTSRQYLWDKLDLAAVTDRQGRTTTYTHDADRNLVVVSDPLGQVTRMTYTPDGDLATLTDPNGHVTTWTRDLEGRVIANTHDDGKGDTYSYDVANRLVSKTDALGQTTNHVYDAANLLIDTSYANAVQPTAAVTYQYDAAYPRLVGMSDGLGVTSFQYVPAGTPGALQLQAVAGPFGANDTVSYSYDADGRLASRNTDASDSFAYDALGRITTETNALGTFNNGYLGDTSQLTTQTRFGFGTAEMIEAMSASYADNTGDRQLSGLSWTSTPKFTTQTQAGACLPRPLAPCPPTTKLIGALQFTHSAEHQVLSRVLTTPTSSGIGGLAGTNNVAQSTYAYDGAGRLVQTTLQVTGLPPSSATATFNYDAAGNLTSYTDGATTFNATANDLNQLSLVNGTAWQYDADGNLINDGRYQYQWDAANRLVGIMDSTTGTVTSFAYDGLDRRMVIGQSDASGNHAETRYLWCGDEVCGARNTSGQVLADYYPQGEQHDNYTVSGTRETANSYYLRDQIGSVIGVMDATGNLLGSTDYTSYGMTRSTSGQQADFGYAGMLRGPAGLYLTKYRAYSPAAGRWLSRDPIGMAGGENVYAYVEGDPVARQDAFGLLGPYDGYSFSDLQGFAAQAQEHQIEQQAAEAAAPHAVGLGVAVSAEGGTVFSAGGQASAALAVSTGGSFFTRQYGAELSFLDDSASFPCECGNGRNFAIGAEVSGGPFFFMTNARNASDLRGCSKTWSFNTPYGSASLSLSDGIWSITASGPAIGADISSYQTYSQ